MISVSVTDIQALTVFWLVFTRWLAILMLLPIFDNTTIPPMVKVLTSLIISYAFYPLLSPVVGRDLALLGGGGFGGAFWALTIYYAISGLILGFIVKSIMDIFISAGDLITQQIGFGAVRYYDPQSGGQVGPFEKLITWTVLIIVLSSGALIPMFKGAIVSFTSMGWSRFANMSMSPDFFMTFFKDIFLGAILLSTPLIFTNMIIMAILGIISRIVPQMNVLMVSFVVNIGLGLIVFSASSSEFFHVAFKIYTDRLGDWFHFVSV